MEKLAINGGRKAVPDGTVKNWPPIDDVDRKTRPGLARRRQSRLRRELRGVPDRVRRVERQQIRRRHELRHRGAAHGAGGVRRRLRRRGDRDGLLLVLLRHLHPPPQRHPGFRGHQLRHDQHGRVADRAGDHEEDQGHHRRPSPRPADEHGEGHGHRPAAQAEGRRGRLPGARGDVQGAQGRHVGTLRRVQFQPEQMSLRGRGRNVRHRQ